MANTTPFRTGLKESKVLHLDHKSHINAEQNFQRLMEVELLGMEGSVTIVGTLPVKKCLGVKAVKSLGSLLS